jgi:membrane fusion protein (multidrug efflux system)
MKRKIIIITLFLIAMVALFFGYKANRSFLVHYPRVQAGLSTRGDLVEDIEVAGQVNADEVRDLYLNSEARVQEVRVKEGDRVRAGQILIVFDSDDGQLQLAQCQADILRLEQDLAIQKSNGVSENGLKIGAANLKVLNLRKNILEKNLRELTVTAPIPGLISWLTLKTGERVTPGTKVAQIIDESKVSVTGEIPPDDSSRLKIGDPTEISFGTLAKPYKAQIAQVLPPVKKPDSTFSNVRIKLRILDPGVRLIPGNSIRIRIRVGQAKLAVTVPVEALHEETTAVRGAREYFSVLPASGERRKYLYVLRDCSETLGLDQEKEKQWMIRDNIYQARKVYVETGLSSVDRIEITRGLKPFEQVIIYNDRPLRDYNRVIVINRDKSYQKPITSGGGS